VCEESVAAVEYGELAGYEGVGVLGGHVSAWVAIVVHVVEGYEETVVQMDGVMCGALSVWFAEGGRCSRPGG
jgi:hypothetical protein